MQFKNSTIALTAIIFAASFLSGCGGGGGATPTVNGTYTGTIYRLYNAIKYTGPASMTVSGGNTMTGTWTVSPENSSGPLPSYVVNLTGTVDAAGVLTGNGSIGGTTNVMPMNGIVDKVSGKITGSYTFSGGVAPFSGDYALAK